MTDGLGPLAALVSSLTWTIGVSFYSAIGDRSSPYSINFTRAWMSGALCFLVACFLFGGPVGVWQLYASVPHAQFGYLVGSVLASYALGDSVFLMSTRGLGVPGALAIASIYPLWSALAGVFLKGESLSVWSILGLLIVVGGTVLVILAPSPLEQKKTVLHDEVSGALRELGASADEASLQAPVAQAPSRHWLDRKVTGLLLALVTSLCWSINTYTVSKGGEGLNAFIGNSLRMGFAAIFAPIVALVITRDPRQCFLRPGILRILAPAIVIEGFLGSVLYYYGITHSPLALGSALTAVAPVMAVPVGLLMGRELFSRLRTAGVVLVCAGICALVLGR